MPNWCENNVVVTGKRVDVQQLVNTVRGQDRVFSFEKIIPMPEDLKTTQKGSDSSDGLGILDPKASESEYQLALWRLSGRVPELGAKIHRANGPFMPRETARALLLSSSSQAAQVCVHQAQAALASREKHGFDNWYDWSVANWGTKWDACDSVMNEIEDLGDGLAKVDIHFSTAWSWPEAILRKLIEMFPALEFEISADEEAGFFYLDARTEDGELIIDEHEGVREGGPFDYEDADD